MAQYIEKSWQENVRSRIRTENVTYTCEWKGVLAPDNKYWTGVLIKSRPSYKGHQFTIFVRHYLNGQIRLSKVLTKKKNTLKLLSYTVHHGNGMFTEYKGNDIEVYSKNKQLPRNLFGRHGLQLIHNGVSYGRNKNGPPCIYHKNNQLSAKL